MTEAFDKYYDLFWWLKRLVDVDCPEVTRSARY